jgi:putative FmdB family regulatory protein
VPIYQYGCRDCGRTFDELRAIGNRDDEAMCSTCSSKDVTRSLDVPFSRSSGAKSEPPNETSDARSESPVNATLENCGTGMEFDGVKIRGCDWYFKDIKGKAIDSVNSDVEVGGDISIE